MKVKDNAKIHKIKENVLMNTLELKQNQRKKTDVSGNNRYKEKNIACINSFLSYFINQEKNNSKELSNR